MQMPNTSSPVYSQIDGEEPKTTFSSITIRFGDDCSEPVIGPGMILERGRDRFIIGREAWGHIRDASKAEPKEFSVCAQRRGIFGTWSVPARTCRNTTDVEIAAMLLSGFRVIRPADTQAKEPPCQK